MSNLLRNDSRDPELLGHSDPKLTARVYSHLALEDLRDAVERLDGNDRSTSLVSSRSS
jgi:hypothetical protein